MRAMAGTSYPWPVRRRWNPVGEGRGRYRSVLVMSSPHGGIREVYCTYTYAHPREERSGRKSPLIRNARQGLHPRHLISPQTTHFIATQLHPRIFTSAVLYIVCRTQLESY
jgi:hypothetical protein